MRCWSYCFFCRAFDCEGRSIQGLCRAVRGVARARALRFASLCLLPIAAFANIELSLSETQCQPGDVIELHAESSFDELVTYEIKLPQHEALHLVAHQRQPVDYADGNYRKKDVWVLQPMRSGEIELSEIKAFVQKDGVVSELDLPKQVIDVQAYAAAKDDFTPEALPDVKEVEQGGARFLVLLFILGGVVVVALVFARKPSIEKSAPEAAPTLVDMKAALVSGEIPSELIEQLLADESIAVSEELRTAMERAVYGQDVSALKSLLEREAAQ